MYGAFTEVLQGWHIEQYIYPSGFRSFREAAVNSAWARGGALEDGLGEKKNAPATRVWVVGLSLESRENASVLQAAS